MLLKSGSRITLLSPGSDRTGPLTLHPSQPLSDPSSLFRDGDLRVREIVPSSTTPPLVSVDLGWEEKIRREGFILRLVLNRVGAVKSDVYLGSTGEDPTHRTGYLRSTTNTTLLSGPSRSYPTVRGWWRDDTWDSQNVRVPSLLCRFGRKIFCSNKCKIFLIKVLSFTGGIS